MDESIVKQLNHGNTVTRTIKIKNLEDFEKVRTSQVLEILGNTDYVACNIKGNTIKATFIKPDGSYYFLYCVIIVEKEGDDSTMKKDITEYMNNTTTQELVEENKNICKNCECGDNPDNKKLYDEMFSLISNFIICNTNLSSIDGVDRIVVNLHTLQTRVSFTNESKPCVLRVQEPEVIKSLFVKIREIMKQKPIIIPPENIFMVDISARIKSFLVTDFRITHHI